MHIRDLLRRHRAPSGAPTSTLRERHCARQLANRHVTIQHRTTDHVVFDAAGFDLCDAELDALEQALDDLARPADAMLRRQRRQGTSTGFGINLDGGCAADLDIVRRHGDALVRLDGSDVTDGACGYQHPPRVPRQCLVRGPWVWRSDGRRWADPDRTVESLLIAATRRRGGAGIHEASLAAEERTRVERAVWDRLLSPIG